MEELDSVLLHYGVKGMKWGVIKKGLSSRVGSIKREHQWRKVKKQVKTMSTKDINKVALRIQQENDLRRLSKTKEQKAEYRRRGEMSDVELNRKVTRLRAVDSLDRQIKEATRPQRELGEKIIGVSATLGVKAALNGSVTAMDISSALRDSKGGLKNAKRTILESTLQNVDKKTTHTKSTQTRTPQQNHDALLAALDKAKAQRDRQSQS